MIDQSIIHLVSIDGSQITEHNRKISLSEIMNVSDIELANGGLKRYFKRNKRSINLTFNYLPNLAIYTADGRVGRDYLRQLAQKRGTVEIEISESPSVKTDLIYAYVVTYSENLIRREVNNRLAFYDVSMSFEEV